MPDSSRVSGRWKRRISAIPITFTSWSVTGSRNGSNKVFPLASGFSTMRQPLVRGGHHGQEQKKQAANRFEVGRHGGCEALLFEFREKSPRIVESDDPGSTHLRDPHTARIAANTFDEALEYLRWDQPRFVIDSVQNLGLIFLVSGSPLD